MININEKTIEHAAKELTSNPVCRVILTENGHYLYEADGKTHKLCQGRFGLENGRVKLIGTCNEPCSFICDNGRRFDENVSIIRAVIIAINEVTS